MINLTHLYKQLYKRLPVFIIIFTFYSVNFSQTLTIIDQDYEKAKIESQKQNKLLLIDFYTTWCAPCKQIERMIFNDETISSEMSKSFVVLRYDAEKDETHRLSLKHHIGSYPATVVLNSDQFVLHKLYGFGGPEKDLVKNYQAFLNEAMVNNSKNDYVKGVSNTTKDLVYPKFYEDYVFRKNTKLDEEKVLKDYWGTNKDYLSEVSFAVFIYFGGTDEVDSFFLDNLQKYESLYGKTDVGYVKSKMSFTKFAKAIEAKDRKLLASAVEFARKIYDKDKADKYIDVWEQNMLVEENKWNEAIELFVARKKRENLDDDSTYYFCSTVNEKSDDKKTLEKCVSLMKDVTDKKPESEYLNTYAHLLYKTGDFNLSKTVLKKAIKIGKSNKEDTQDSEKLLKLVQDKINQKPSQK